MPKTPIAKYGSRVDDWEVSISGFMYFSCEGLGSAPIHYARRGAVALRGRNFRMICESPERPVAGADDELRTDLLYESMKSRNAFSKFWSRVDSLEKPVGVFGTRIKEPGKVIPRRVGRDEIGTENVISIESRVHEDAIELLTGSANEWLSFSRFVIAPSFANQEDFSVSGSRGVLKNIFILHL